MSLRRLRHSSTVSLERESGGHAEERGASPGGHSQGDRIQFPASQEKEARTNVAK
jgi:hypothetical protein